jgi:hypothetical protein
MYIKLYLGFLRCLNLSKVFYSEEKIHGSFFRRNFDIYLLFCDLQIQRLE